METNRTSWHPAVIALATIVTVTRPVIAAEGARSADASVMRRVVVSIPDRKLALIENDRIVRIYPVAVGAPVSPSPVGTFSIVTRVSNPTYYKPGKIVGPGSANPIGTRWIGLSAKGYGIHGTDAPRSIGFAKSHGCIRLRNRDVEALFARVRTGDVVELHAERTPEIAQLFGEIQ
jgi:L,D-transpeptidase ErfK/SrfK